jgi:hypothetical protein
MPRNVGDTITAVSFNTVVDRWNVLWQDPKDSNGDPIAYTYDISLHKSEVLRRLGWGQPSNNMTVTANTLIEAKHYNLLAAHVNSGEYHREDSSMTINNYVTQNVDVVLASDMNPLEAVMTSYENTDAKFDLGATGELIETHAHSNGGVAWGTNDAASALTRGTLTTIQKYTWTDYNDARHFFNSGGQIIIDLEAIGGSFGHNEWDYIFDQIDTIYVGAKQTTKGGANGTGIKSFYEFDDTYQQIFNAQGFDTGDLGAYAGQYTYSGVYVSGEGYAQYGGREVTVYAKIGMDGTNFCLWLKTELTEDADDVAQVDANITLNTGYRVAQDAPDTGWLGSSNGSVHKVDGTAYIFQTRIAKVPTIITEQNWTPNP